MYQLLFYFPLLQDLEKAYNMMLGNPKWQQLDYMPYQGLFGERKQTKFFQVIFYLENQT